MWSRTASSYSRKLLWRVRRRLPRSFRQALTPGLIFGAVRASRLVFIAATVVVGAIVGRSDIVHLPLHYVACGSGLTLPRTVRIADGVDKAVVRSGFSEWNNTYGTVFIEVAGVADVDVVPSQTTWVQMPCSNSHAVIHVGGDVDLHYWMAHEFGHALGLADHIRSYDDTAIYVNPGFCPEDGYVGIMSYCTPRELWFGPGDMTMMKELFPRPRPGLTGQAFVPGVASGQ